MSAYPLSGSRAGVGSAVVASDPTTNRTINVAGVGVVATGTSGGGGGTTQPVRVQVLA
jgi:hypothetical protein